MIITATDFQQAAFRHAEHYLQLLNVATAHLEDLAGDAQQEFHENWPQIDYAFHFMWEQSQRNSTAATLCIRYAAIGFNVILSWGNPQHLERWLQQGLACARNVEDMIAEIDILINFARLYVFIPAEMSGAGRAAVERALYLAEYHNYRTGIANALLELGRWHMPNRQLDIAGELLWRAARLFDELGDDRQFGWTLHNLASVAELRRDYDTAKMLLSQAIAIFREIDAPRHLGQSLGRLGSVLEQLGDFENGYRYAKSALDVAYQSQDAVLLAGSLLRIGLLAGQWGKRSLYRIYMKEAVDVCRKAGLSNFLSTALQNLAWLAHEDDDHSLMETYLDEVLAIAQTLKYAAREVIARASLALPYIMQGRYENAYETLRTSWRMAHELDYETGQAYTIWHLCLLCLHTGDLENTTLLYGIDIHYFADSHYQDEIDYIQRVLSNVMSQESLVESVQRAALIPLATVHDLVDSLLNK